MATSNMRPATGYVLDSYAVLAHLRAEAAAPRVRGLLDQATGGECRLYVSVVNLGEVLYRTERDFGPHQASEALGRIMGWPIGIVPADLRLSVDAARVKARFPIAYAGCFCIALAQRENAIVVTGDPEFRRVEGIVQIEWLAKES